MGAFFRRFGRRVLVAAVLVRRLAHRLALHRGGLAREQRALDVDTQRIRHWDLRPARLFE
ncbi:hypothetical protein [Herbiconiux daphne]|uniref:DUF1127 domain-containing protein n=1 Tax=Herbiconiux daphne TaxID=2970914 RepID=A0ABT2H147_9MICO|nr:hypothetical protein [Herbiconiux daphne]MCS5733652.1 hypothetical protein [Herbiconiux daphne]